MYDTPRWLKATAIILSVLIFAGMLCFIYLEDQEAAELEAHMEMLNQKTYAYRREKQDLEMELRHLAKKGGYVSERAMLMIGFILSGDSDLDYIAQKANQYQFNPVLIVDCTIDNTDSFRAISETDSIWDVIFYAPGYTEYLEKQIISTRNKLAGLPINDTGLLFISGEPSKEKPQAVVADCGLIGYAEYSDPPTSGQNEDGSVFFDYTHFKLSHYSPEAIPAIEDRLSACINHCAAMLCVFDMNHLNTNAGARNFADTIFETIKEMDVKSRVFSAATDVVDELKTFNQRNAEWEKKNAKRRGEIEKEIEELEKLIGEIMQS